MITLRGLKIRDIRFISVIRGCKIENRQSVNRTRALLAFIAKRRKK